MKISPDELRKAALEFKIASGDSDEIIHRLNSVVKSLDASWDDANQQMFYKYFQEWYSYASGISQLLFLISGELEAVAEKYSDADSSVSQ